MAPKRTTRSTPVTPTPNATPTTTVTEAQNFKALNFDQELLRVKCLRPKQAEFRNAITAMRVADSLEWMRKLESDVYIEQCTQLVKVKFATFTHLQDMLLHWEFPMLRPLLPELLKSAHAMPLQHKENDD
ncbi:hypothetical protein Tco_0708230 [Tanacetum coccineum]